MGKMSGKAGNAVTPASPMKPELADVAGSGEASKGESQNQSGKADNPPPHKPPETEEEKERKTSWIEIELVGEDDKPIPGERFEIILPDGTMASGTLNEKGMARVEGIEQGTCKIRFPELDKEAWEKV